MLKIKDLRIRNPFALAPMAGVNCTAFRVMCKEAGAGLVFTQMYHCDFIRHKLETDGKKAVFDFINLVDKERPVAVQLIGSRPENMTIAAKLLEKKADMIDINLGCPDKDMVKARCGGYFSRHPELIEGIIKPVVDEIRKPVSAKIRIGWDSQTINGVAVAQKLERIGVDAITVHGRTVAQKYSGKANWEIIRHIRDKLSIPVVGNGDITSSGKAIEMLDRTGCDIVMIGRRAMGDPGIFTRCINRYTKLKDPDAMMIDVPDAAELFLRFAKHYKRYDSDKSFTELRTHALWFSKRARLGPKARQEICRAKDIETITGLFGK